MGENEILVKLKQAVIDLNQDAAMAAAKEAIEAGVEPLKAIEEGLQPGIEIIGDKFDKLECFLPELIGSANVFRAAVDVFEPEIAKSGISKHTSGIAVIGTVKGDIHKIGKDIVVLLLKTRGFEVHDLGEDVPASEFLKAAENFNADIVGLSALLNTTMPAQQDVINLFKEQGVREKYMLMVGGAPVTQEWADEIGADAYAKTAEEGVSIALKHMSENSDTN
jgi:trimethylamine corrinoid protein